MKRGWILAVMALMTALVVLGCDGSQLFSPGPTPTPSSTPTGTQTPTPLSTDTPTPTETATASLTRTITNTPIPKPRVKTSKGDFLVNSLEMNDKFPRGCVKSDWFCYLATENRTMLYVWLEKVDRSTDLDGAGFVKITGQVTVKSAGGYTTAPFAGGILYGEYVLAFRQPVEKEYTLYWGTNPPIPMIQLMDADNPEGEGFSGADLWIYG